MSGPWEKFSSQPAAAASAQGPWSKFSGQAAPVGVEPKVKREGWTGVLQGGVESAGRAIGSAYDAITGDNASIVERANANQNVEKDAALSDFYSDIEASRQQLGEDAGLVDSIGAVGGAIARNKEGAGKAIVEQLPNSAAALGGGWAGMKAGAALGAFAGPVGAGIGGVIGGLAGMFLGNAALEVGNKAMDAAKDGVVTDEERTGAIKEGGVKAAVITGVDAVTLGGSKWLTGVTSRAMEAATRKTLLDAGVDVTSRTAVEAARKSPEISRAVLRAQEAAVTATSKFSKKAAGYGAAGALETMGEGVGEYVGELAATGKADMIDAVLESALSAPQSGAEIAWGVSRNEADARGKMWEEAPEPERPTLALPDKGAPTQYVFPDGSTTTNPEEARRFIETLPADQRNAAYEQLLNGKWQKDADPKFELQLPGAEQASEPDAETGINWIDSGPRTYEQRMGQMAEEADRARQRQQKERDLLRLVGDSKLVAELDRAEEQDAITRAAGRDVPLDGAMQSAFQGAQQANPSAPAPTAEPSAQDRALAQRLLNTRTSPPPQPPTPTRPDMLNEFERARRAAEAQKAAELEQLAAESRVPAAEFDAQRSDRIMEAAGVGDTQPTALQLAMQRAQAAPAPAQSAPQDIAQLRDADRSMAQRLLRARTGPSGTVTESEADIQSQVRGYAEGKRGPVFVDGDVPATAVPDGMAIVPSQYGGNYVAKSEDAAAIEQIERQAGDKEIARQQILGYVQSKPDAMASGNPVIVQSRDAQGGIVKQELVDGNDPQAVQAAQQSQAPGGAVEVTTPEAAMAERIDPPDAVQLAQQQADSRPEFMRRSYQREATARNAAKKNLGARWEQGHEVVKVGPGAWGIVERKQSAPEPAAKRGPVPRGEAKSLLELVRRAGGVAKRLENDIAGEPTVRRKGYPVGVFRENGMGEDMLAELMQQHGYLSEADVMGSDSGAEVAMELMRSALAGERVVPIAERERLMAEAEEKAYRDSIRREASEAGIKVVGRKFSDLENDVLALRERQHEARAAAMEAEDRALYDEVLQEVRDSGIMAEEEIEALIERNMNAPLRELAMLLEAAYQARIEEINAEAADARAPRELNEQEYRDAFERENQGEAGGAAARAPIQRVETGRREADQREAAPDAAAGQAGFQLESPSERELKARIAALEQAEAQRKQEEAEAERRRQADAERGQFMLTGSDRPADVLAAQGQASIFDQPAPTQASVAPDQPQAQQANDRVTRDRPMNDGATIADAQGNQYRVHYQRNDLVVAHPIINGNPQVSADTTVRFWTNQDTTPSGDNDRTDPIYPVAQPTQAPTASAQSRQAPSPRSESAQQRTLDADGRASDGKPIMPGDTFSTLSGRTTTPYPKQKGEKYASQWLIDNAVAEAESRGDSYNARSFGATKPMKRGDLAPADRDSMLMYLFEQQPSVAPSILRPLTQGAQRSEAAQPWQQTRDEYLGRLDQPDHRLSEGERREKRNRIDEHAQLVREAVERGDSVPDRVLADFASIVRPDLNDDQIDRMIDDVREKSPDKIVAGWRAWRRQSGASAGSAADRQARIEALRAEYDRIAARIKQLDYDYQALDAQIPKYDPNWIDSRGRIKPNSRAAVEAQRKAQQAIRDQQNPILDEQMQLRRELLAAGNELNQLRIERRAAGASGRNAQAEPITVTAQRRVRTDDGMVVEIDLSNGKTIRIARLNGVESMGLPGWHDIDNAAVNSYLGDTKDQAIEEILRSENARQDRSRESRASTAGDNFRRWFGESRIVDEDGEPLVMYHGTTHPDITVFRRAGTPESFLGQGPYFTSSAPDASANYAGVGPDLTSRIEREAERIADEFHDDDYAAEEILRDYFEDNGIDLEAIGIEDVEAALDDLKDEHGEAAIEHAAHKRLKGASDGLMMPVYLKVERPFDMTDAGRDLYLEYDTNENGDIESERGEIVTLIEAINSVAGGFDVSQGDIDDFNSWLYENGLDGLSPREIFDHGQRTLQVYADSDGESVSFGQFWQEVLRETGLYDGMIQDADLYFGTQRRGFGGARIPGMEGVTPGTIHVVPFSPEQVKSAIGNSGDFNPASQNILESRGRSESAAAITNSPSANTDKVRRLIERARSILGGDAKLVRFAEQLLSRADGQPISGRYTPNQLRGVIEVALNSRNPLGALNHEAFHHALEAFFTPAQARIIKMAFAPGGALAAKVKKQLRLDGETAVLADRDYLDGEELSAFGFQYFAAGRLKFGGDVGAIFKALGDMVERVRNWINGAGFNTVEELFQALDQGKLGPQGPKGGRRAPARESRSGSAPSAMAIEAARAKAAQSRAAFRSFDAQAEQVGDADRYFDLVGQAIDDEAALVAALDAMPQEAFGAQASTPDGRMMIVNASAQQPGKWQLTYFGKDGAPWMDVQHTTRAAALKEMVSQAELGTLVAENAQGRESRAGQGRQAQATPGSRQSTPAAAANPGMIKRAKQSLKWLDSIMNPLGKMEDQRQYLLQRYRTMGAIAKWEEIGKQIYDTLRKADKADAKATFAYLTTKGANPGGIRNAEVRAKAVEVKQLIDKVGQALVRRGIIPQASYEKYRDSYLPRMYLRYLLDDSINQFATTGAGRKPSSLGYTKARKDLDPEVREVLLGEVTDPAFLSATGIVRAMRDLFLLHWMEQISGNAKWVLPAGVVEWNGQRVTPHWLKSEAEQLRKQADFYDNPDAERKARQIARQMDAVADAAFEAMGQSEVNIEDYKQMPNTARYGRLRGLWVRNEVYDDIMGVAGMAPENSNWLASTFGYGGVGTKITQAFKVTKVTLNPASQVRNFVSNMVLLQLSGVPLHRIPVLIKNAINEMANGGRHYQIAKKYGITESSFSSQELFRMKKELLDLEERMHGLSPWGKVRKMAGVVVEFAGEKYQKVEELGKVMKIIDGMERNQLSEEDAVLEAQKWLFDYSLVPSWLRYARNAPIGAPFLTFTMKVLPRLMETATEHPQRFLPWVGMWFGLSMMAAASLGYDEDEMKAARESLPKWAREKTHVAILPFKDEDGRLNYIDLGYHFPWTMWVELAQNVVEGNPKGALQSMGALSGPIPDLLIVARTGIDPFTGQEVWNKAEPESVRWGKTLGYLYNMAVPPWLATNGPLAKLGNEDTDKFGNLKATAGQAIGQGLGFPYRKFNPAQSRAQNLQVMQYELGEAERAMRTKLRSMQRATPEERQEAIDMHVEHIRDMAKELQEYAKRSAMPARPASQP